jgi:outer membrane lipoprotein-sorting protein
MRSFGLPTEPPQLAVCVGVVAMALLFACKPPRYAPATPVSTDPAAVLAGVRQREDQIHSLRARFKATAFHGSGESDVHGVLLVRKTNRFRMRLMLPLGITVLDYVNQGDRAWTLSPLSNGDDAEEARLFSPADVRETFLRGAAAFPGTCLATGESAAIVEVACRACDDCPLLRSLHLDRRNGTISEETSYDGGEPRLAIRYADYREVFGQPLPFRVVMTYPARRLKVEIQIRAYEVNPELKDELFEPPPGSKLETVVATPEPSSPTA